MNKILFIIFTFLCSLSAFGSEEKILIAYFGRLGNTNYSQNIDATAAASVVIANGNRLGTTESVGKIIQKYTGGNLYLIQSKEKYPADFDETVSKARSERRSGYIPELINNIENFDQYDTVFIGYPVWGTTLPAPVTAFLKQYDFSGKNVVTFCTHDGYGRGVSTTTIKNLIPNANVMEGIALESHNIVSNSMVSTERDVKNWLDTLNIQPQKKETNITVSVNGEKLEAVLYDTPTAREFIKRLPQTISMYGYGGREYYGSIDDEIQTDEIGKLNFEDEDITYCPQNNSIAIFYAQTDNPNLTMRVIPIGKIRSDLNIFQNLSRRENISFSLKK